MSVISALLGVLALTESTKGFSQFQKPIPLVVCMFAIALCIVWTGTIRFYQVLFEAKLRVLKELEEHLPFFVFCQRVQFHETERGTYAYTDWNFCASCSGSLFSGCSHYFGSVPITGES